MSILIFCKVFLLPFCWMWQCREPARVWWNIVWNKIFFSSILPPTAQSIHSFINVMRNWIWEYDFTSGSSNHSWHHILPVGPPPVWTSSEIYFSFCTKIDFEEFALVFLLGQGPKCSIGTFQDSKYNANLSGRQCLSFCRSLGDPEMRIFSLSCWKESNLGFDL